jgi:hypothetical protein
VNIKTRCARGWPAFCELLWQPSSCADEPQSNGLSEFGREVVVEMNLLGMLVDISRVWVATMNAALDVSACRAVAEKDFPSTGTEGDQSRTVLSPTRTMRSINCG